MQNGGLPVPAGPKEPKDESDQPRIERAPVSVDGVCKITAKVGAGNVKVRVTVAADVETGRQGLQKPCRNSSDPHRDSDKLNVSHRHFRLNLGDKYSYISRETLSSGPTKVLQIGNLAREPTTLRNIQSSLWHFPPRRKSRDSPYTDPDLCGRVGRFGAQN